MQGKGKIKVALVSLYNRECAFGIRYLSSVLKQQGHHVDIAFFKQRSLYPDVTQNLQFCNTGFSAPYSRQELHLLIDLIGDLSPDLIGISLSSSYFRMSIDITRKLKEKFTVPIIWGGVHPTLMPEESIKYPDMVCVGEGEGAMVELADKLGRGEDFSNVDNLWVKREDGTLVKNEIRPLIQELDSLGFPDYTDEDKYYIHKGTCSRQVPEEEEEVGGGFHMMTSRGCPYSCTYCCNCRLRELFKGKGSYIRRRSVKSAIDELVSVVNRNPERYNYIHFWDDVFTIHKEWLREFGESYTRCIALPFSCYSHPNAADYETLQILKDAGVACINLGIQTGSERTNYDIFNRHTKNEKIVEFAKMCAQLDIPVWYDLILDNPYEDDDDHRHTLELMLSLPRPFELNTHSLCYFPKMDLTERALKDGLICEDEVEGLAIKALEDFHMRLSMVPKRENHFWNTLIGMTRYRFFSAEKIGSLSHNRLLYRFPKLLSLWVRTTLRLIMIRRALARGLKELGNRLFSGSAPAGLGVFVEKAVSDLEGRLPRAVLKNSSGQEQRAVLSLDIYPSRDGRHPDRHLGCWNSLVSIPPGDTVLETNLSFPDVRFQLDSTVKSPDERWVGSIREEGWYEVNFVLYARRGLLSRLGKGTRLLAKAHARVHSSALFGSA